MQVVFMTPEVGATRETTLQLSKLYSVMVAVDVFVAEVWMFFLLLGVGKADTIDRWFKADSSSIEELKNKMEQFSKKVAGFRRQPILWSSPQLDLEPPQLPTGAVAKFHPPWLN